MATPDDIVLGEEREPHSVNVRTFVAARIAEIECLTDFINADKNGNQTNGQNDNQGSTKGFPFQHVSKHMRRRAVSHNPKRVPSRLRGRHLACLSKCTAGSAPTEAQRPTRKYKKRPEANIVEFNRRQLGKPGWLESHVWHAKRFHMKPYWDKKIAVAPTAKCFRSLVGAARNRAIMQDISYLTCLEIEGPEQVLLERINLLFPHGYGTLSTGFSSTEQYYNKELICHAYSTSKTVYIGPARCLWLPAMEDTRKLIIWVHPATKDNFISELILIFQMEEAVNVVASEGFPECPNKDEQKYSWRLLMNKTWKNKTTHVILKDASGCYNRIRLTGWKSIPILKQILKVGRIRHEKWGSEEEVRDKQETFWSNVKNNVTFPNNTLIHLNVVDPRLELLDKRQPVEVSEESVRTVGDSPTMDTAQRDSFLWVDDFRRNLLHNKLSDSKLAEFRSKMLIPGTKIHLREEVNVVPVALVFRVGSHHRDGNSPFVGIDLILPHGWLMPFWVALSYRCVRAYGVEFNDYLSFEEDPYRFDLITGTVHPPDLSVYQIEESKRGAELKEKYFDRPPAKRHNLIKLGCAWPFSIDWEKFLKYTLGKDKDQSDAVEIKVVRRIADVAAMSHLVRSLKMDDAFFDNESSLIPFQIILVTGSIEERACVCLPTKEDLELFANEKNRVKRQITQDKLTDSNEHARADLTRTHHKRLSLLRKKRKIARRGAEKKSFDLDSRLETLDSKEECDQYNSKMETLWMNHDIDDVLSKQSREIVGLVIYAHYSFIRGKSAGIGYVSYGQLKKLVSVHNQCAHTKISNGKKSLYALVRNWQSSLVYHWAEIIFP